jgi:outer membrane protein TolC
LTLGALLDSVAARHPLVEAAHARVRAAQGSRRAAGTIANPVLGYDVENAPLPGGASPTMDREIMTTVMLPLEELYQRGPRVRRATAELRAAAADAAATEQRVALDAAGAYFRTALAQIALDAARDVSAWLDTVVVYNR